MKTRALLAVAFGTILASSLSATRSAAAGRGDGPIVYVMGQDLYYDSIITADPLPPAGQFQQLFLPDADDDRLRTEFGPGDRGYRGGRWWVDVDGNGEMSEGDDYFSCPLLGPGRAEP